MTLEVISKLQEAEKLLEKGYFYNDSYRMNGNRYIKARFLIQEAKLLLKNTQMNTTQELKQGDAI